MCCNDGLTNRRAMTMLRLLVFNHRRAWGIACAATALTSVRRERRDQGHHAAAPVRIRYFHPLYLPPSFCARPAPAFICPATFAPEMLLRLTSANTCWYSV